MGPDLWPRAKATEKSPAPTVRALNFYPDNRRESVQALMLFGAVLSMGLSREEITVVAELVRGLMGRRWTDSAGHTRSIRPEDVLVVAPAQVDRLQVTLPAGCAAGTVDRFQGQEAPVVIYSLATSCPEDMPRQMEFLYSLNRLNVAISRARGLAILVCSPAILRIRCRRPEQMRLANAFCRLVELGSRQAPQSAVEPHTLTVAP